MSDLAIIETLNAVDLYEGEEMNAHSIVGEICAEYRANVYDVSDEKGRKALSKDAAIINKWSNGLDDLGKKHVAILKDRPKLIDAERKKMRDSLANLRTDMLKPLVEYEDNEKARIAGIQNRITNMMVSVCGVMSTRTETLEGAKDFMFDITHTVIDDSFQEFKEQAANQNNESELMLAGIIAKFRKEKAEADHAEKIKAEADARARLEHEERIKQEAADNATKEAEAKAEQEKQEILAREQKALDDAAKAEQDKIATEQKAKLEQEQAVQAEKDRAEKAVQDEIDAEKLRARNTQHRSRINNDALNALVCHSHPQSKITEAQARHIVTLIAKGMIPNVSISY